MKNIKSKTSILTTGELARICGFTMRTILWYTETGLIQPLEDKKGNRLTYSQDYEMEQTIKSTERCPTCPSRGTNRDCAGCGNLESLKLSCIG
jgi:hypothetical protein